MKKLLFFGSILGIFAVTMGAMGAHALKPILTSDELSWINKGVQYQFIHSIMIFMAAILFKLFDQKIFLKAGWSFVIGIFLFSGSLYLLALKTIIGLTVWKWLGPLTPLGGLSMIIGWILLLIATMKMKNEEK